MEHRFYKILSFPVLTSGRSVCYNRFTPRVTYAKRRKCIGLTYGEKAKAYFYEGYNCAQSIVLTFADAMGIAPETALRLSSSFGGGMGRLREVCGAVSGMFMVIGVLCGYDDPKDPAAKSEHYHRIQALASRFAADHGSIVCRNLLGGAPDSSPTPSARTEAYYKKRPCPELIAYAADLTAEYLIQNHRLSPSNEE